MAKTLLAALILGVSSLAALGCATPDLQTRVDELTRECDDLHKQKSQAESDLQVCRARCDALERDRRGVPRSSGVTATPYVDVPADLKGKVDIRRRGNETVIDIPSDVFFASGSSTLNAGSERTMSQIVDFIKRSHPSGLIRVEGHSDTDPIRRTKNRYHCNWELSFERAHAVMHYLVEKGRIDPHRVACEAYGEFHPQDPQNKSKNRRVEIVIAN